jgi:hypothetical protein
LPRAEDLAMTVTLQGPCEKGWFHAECNFAKGAFGQGKTKRAAVLNLFSAIEELRKARKAERN